MLSYPEFADRNEAGRLAKPLVQSTGPRSLGLAAGLTQTADAEVVSLLKAAQTNFKAAAETVQ